MIIAVTDRKKAKDYTAMMRKNGLSTILTLQGRGTASQDVLGILGLEDTEKVLLLAAADRPKTAAVFRDAHNKLYVDIPGNGIIAAMPIRCIGGTETLNYLTNDKTVKKSNPDIKFDKEMIFVILNSGFTEEVMEAARTAGAGGGTVIEAKGSGSRFAHKFLGLTIAEDKQILLIVTNSVDRSAIISAIMSKCGPGFEPGAVAFSVPATQIAGIRLAEDDVIIEDEEEEEEVVSDKDGGTLSGDSRLDGDNNRDASDNSGIASDNSGTASGNSGIASDNSGTASDNSGIASDNSGTASGNSGIASDNSGGATDGANI